MKWFYACAFLIPDTFCAENILGRLTALAGTSMPQGKKSKHKFTLKKLLYRILKVVKKLFTNLFSAVALEYI